MYVIEIDKVSINQCEKKITERNQNKPESLKWGKRAKKYKIETFKFLIPLKCHFFGKKCQFHGEKRKRPLMKWNF